MPTEEKVTRKLRAILSADVKGYSLLMSDDEAFTVKTLKEYRALMSKRIEYHTGRVVDAPGDNLLAEFASVVDAVECAVEIQQALNVRNRDLPADKRLEFRIGVNIGDVIQDGDSLYGEGVNIAARIEGLADAGGVCISRNAYDHIRNKLNYGYEYLGEHSVKNIKQPVRVYKLLMADEDSGKLIGVKPKPVVKNWIWATIVVAAVIITSVVILVYQNVSKPEFEPAKVEEMAYPLPDKPSIAVLPFRNMSGDPAKDYMADGLTENIITNLVKFPEVFVISRESSFYYKGKNIQIKTVSEELGVRYVLEGSIIVDSNKIRVTAQLIDAITGHHVWAQNYDKDIEGLLTLFDDITLSILKEMQVEIKVGYKELGAGTSNINAYLKVVKGRYLTLLNIEEQNLKARKLFEEAVQLDPKYAYAYTYLGLTYLNEANWAWSVNPRNSRKMAVELFQKSIAMNDNNWANHSLIAFCYYRQDPERALAESEKALALAPGEGLAYISHAYFLRYVGEEKDEIIAEIAEKGRRLSPYLEAMARFWLCSIYFNSGNYDEVITLAESLLKENFLPDRAYTLLIFAHLEAGNVEKARFHAKKLMDINPDFQVLGFLNWEAIKLSADVNDLMEPVRYILYPEDEPIKIYSHDKKPGFNFTYPSFYKEHRKIHQDMVLSLMTPKFNSCSVVITRLTQGQTLDNFWNTYLIQIMNNFGSEFKVKMNKKLILGCGTEARVLEVDWRFYDNTYQNSRFVYAFHSGYGVAAQIMSPVDIDEDFSWIDQSLTFKEVELSRKEPPEKPSIAVLPFDNLSDDPEQGYFSDGISEDIITDLSKISGLIVIARNSSFSYKGKSIKVQQIGQELNVRYLLEGSVRKAGNQVRINAQLIDANSGHHLWADRYDGDMSDIFALQDEISRKIISALALKLTKSEQEFLIDKGTNNIQAYDEFLKGWQGYRLLTKDGFAAAKIHLEKAVELDPEFARGFAALAILYWKAVQSAAPGLREGLGLNTPAAKMAAQAKPQFLLKNAMNKPTALAHGLMSQFYLFRYQHDEALAEIQKAISIDPNDPELYAWLSHILWLSGRSDEAIESAKMGMRLDPINPVTYLIQLGKAYIPDGDLNKSLHALERAKRLNPDLSGVTALSMSIIHGIQGKYEEARTIYEYFLKHRMHPVRNMNALLLYFPFADPKKLDPIAKALIMAGAPGKPTDYYKILKENRIVSQDIKAFLFGHKVAGISIFSGNELQWEWSKSGDFQFTAGTFQDQGKSWVEGDVIFLQYKKFMGGLPYGSTIYRNPDGSMNSKNQYLMVSDIGSITPVALIE